MFRSVASARVPSKFSLLFDIRMLFLDCIGKVLKIIDAKTTIFALVWFIITIWCWTITIRFSFLLHKVTKKQENSPSRVKFFGLMIIAGFILSVGALTNIITWLFTAQFFNPNESVDHCTLCGNNGEFYTYLSHYLSIGAFIWNVQYILILTVYYQRLLLIFKNNIQIISNISIN